MVLERHETERNGDGERTLCPPPEETLKASRKTSRTGTLKRLRFPDAEKAQPWLPMLLDAYAVADEGIMTAVRARTAETGERLACSKGCDACCSTHRDIPVYPLELVGIYWFVVEMLTGQSRESVKKQLATLGGDDSCPFLVDGACAIHPLRPMACRQFNVFNRPCAEGEDAFHSRRQDVLTPLQEYTDRAFAIMLPFYGITGEEEKKRAVRSGYLHTLVRNLRTNAWTELARRMGDYDFRRTSVRGR